MSDKFKGHMLERVDKDIVKLDLTYRKILFLLGTNPRFSIEKISKITRLSRDVVAYRINKLKELKILTGAITLLNPWALGVAINYTIYLQMQNIEKEKEQELIDFFVAHKHIRWVSTCGGKYDMGLVVNTRNIEQFNKIFMKIIEKCGDYLKDYIICVPFGEHYCYPYFLIEDFKHKDKIDLTDKYPGKPDSSFQKEIIAAHKTPQRYEPIKLDKKDTEILKLLETNADMKVSEISKKINLSSSSVMQRIRRLIKERVILRFYPMISYSLIGLQWNMLFLNLRNYDEKRLRQLENYLIKHPHIVWFVKSIGKWNYEVSVFAKDASHYHKIVVDIRNHFKDIVRNYETVTIFTQYKYVFFSEI